MILMLLLISGAFGYVVYPVQSFIVGLLYDLLR
jgi:cell shape-determining protein MreD